jgi:protein gp37
MGKMKEKLYGVADKAWQVVVGCDPKMPCAPRCWARKTVARVVDCQKPTSPDRAEFFQIALTPDGQKWSGNVSLDEPHLKDPLGWKKPAVIATGFHGDWARMEHTDMHLVAAVMALCPKHKFMPLTKQPHAIVSWCESLQGQAERWAPQTKNGKFTSADFLNFNWMRYTFGRGPAFPYHEWPLKNVNIGCSVMNQTEADTMRVPMQQLAAMGWGTHVWYEPAIGPVDWKGWEHVSVIIAGGESGTKSRPAMRDWFCATRDWCLKNDAGFVFKQWGDWAPVSGSDNCIASPMVRVGKKVAGCSLNGREWKELPASMLVTA